MELVTVQITKMSKEVLDRIRAEARRQGVPTSDAAVVRWGLAQLDRLMAAGLWPEIRASAAEPVCGRVESANGRE